MINNRLHTLTEVEYKALRYEVIKQLEEAGEENENIYTDGKGLVTMGVGFNISAITILKHVLHTGFGLDSSPINNPDFNAGKTFADLVSAVDGLIGPPRTPSQNVTQLATLKSGLDALLVEYTVNLTDFSFRSVAAIRNTFEVLADSFETELNGFLGHVSVPYSYERLALISLQYNNAPSNPLLGVGNHISTALSSDDRIAAWYEIRYGSNGGGDKNGVAKRRYIESQLFGLYPESFLASERNGYAQDIYGFLLGDQYPNNTTARNIDQMIGYENLRGHMISSTGTQADINSIEGLTLSVDTFQKMFLPVASELAEIFGHTGLTNPDSATSPDYLEGQAILTAIGAIIINDEVVIGLETNNGIQSTNKDTADDGNDLLIAINDTGQTLSGGRGNDLLIGAAGGDILYGDTDNDLLIGNRGDDELHGQDGSDTLFGGYGDDFLDGGTGDNHLKGGLGNDTLLGGTDGVDTLDGGKGNDIYNISGTGNVTIEDSEGADTYLLINHTGDLITNDSDRIGDQLIRNGMGVNQVYRAVDGEANTWQSFNGKDMITLNSPLTITDESGSKIIINDYQQGDYGIILKDGFTDPLQVILGDQEADKSDNLDGTGSADHIKSGILSDLVKGLDGDDLIEGQSGTDILVGGNGDDRLYADSEDDFSAAFNSDATAAGITRDWLAGGNGEDQLIGSTGGDFLSGGGGHDLLAGGAGNDYLNGDTDWVAQSFGWTVTIANDGAFVFEPVVGGINPEADGDDAIFAGGGDDTAWGGGGNDNIFGDSGNDHLTPYVNIPVACKILF